MSTDNITPKRMSQGSYRPSLVKNPPGVTSVSEGIRCCFGPCGMRRTVAQLGVLTGTIHVIILIK